MQLGKEPEEIPTLKESKVRLFTILEDDNADILDVERIIESDPAMAAKIIRIANSAFYRFTKKVQSIHDAIMVIGFDMVRCITLSMSVMQNFSSNEAIAKDIWRHSFGVALIAMSAARDRDKRGLYFSSGLLHDLGRVIFLWKDPATYVPLFGETWPDINKEQEVLGIDHTVAGQSVAQRWNFPPEVVDIIRDHHNPANHDTGIIYLADTIAHYETAQTSDYALSIRTVEKFLDEEPKELVEKMQKIFHESQETIESLV